MAERTSGVGNIPPTYPVRPVDPARRDRPSGDRRREKPERPTEEAEDDTALETPPDGGVKKNRIDEYI